MLGFIKALPLVIVLAGAGFAYHKMTVVALENRIVDLQEQVDFTLAQNVGLQTAAATNEATIKSLSAKAEAQAKAMGALTQNNQQLSSERDEFMSIFKRHNLTKLARAKPGLIEPRINKGTSEVLRTIEEDSRELDQADDIAGEPDSAPPSQRSSMIVIEQPIEEDVSYTGESNEEAFNEFTIKPYND
jgi:cell division protein FtsB